MGANMFASPIFLSSTLPARESHYFREFLAETDPDKRDQILNVVSPEMRRSLSAQWTAQKARIAVAEGRDPGSGFPVLPNNKNSRACASEARAAYCSCCAADSPSSRRPGNSLADYQWVHKSGPETY